MLFKLSTANSNLALTLCYLNPALNNSTLMYKKQKILAQTRVCLRATQNILEYLIDIPFLLANFECDYWTHQGQ